MNTEQIRTELMTHASSTLADACEKVIGCSQTMKSGISPVFKVKTCGQAVTVLNRVSTVQTPPKVLVETIDSSPAGAVLVCAFEGGSMEASGWGGLLSLASKTAGLAGTIVDAPVRDRIEIEQLEYPVFGAGTTPTSGLGRFTAIASNVSVSCGNCLVCPGDWILADNDGVVVIPHELVSQVLEKASELQSQEERLMRDIVLLGSMSKALAVTNRI